MGIISSGKYFTNFSEDLSSVDSDRKIGITVYSSGGGIQCTNNHRCCSERRLLNLLEHEAKIAGCKGKKIGQWIKKQTGGVIKIWRYTSDGQHGICFPCSICRKSLINYNLKVICTMGPNEWFEGYMTDTNKLTSKLTTGQKRYFAGNARFPLNMRFHT